MMNYKESPGCRNSTCSGVTSCDIVNLALMQYCVQFISALLMDMVHSGLSLKYTRDVMFTVSQDPPQFMMYQGRGPSLGREYTALLDPLSGTIFLENY